MSPSAYHRDVAALTAAHNRRLSSLDPDLGPVPVPDVDGARAVLVARGAVGIWSHQEVHDADLSALWGGRSQDLLAVRSGHGIAPVLGCLLDQLDLIRGTAAPDGDAEVVVRLPALEPGVAPVLLERGLRPVSQTALLRVAPEVPATEEDAVGTVGTRAATPDDVDAVTMSGEPGRDVTAAVVVTATVKGDAAGTLISALTPVADSQALAERRRRLGGAGRHCGPGGAGGSSPRGRSPRGGAPA